MNTRAKSMTLAEVDPAAVIVSGRRRLIDEAWAEAIAATIAERGQDTPIKLRRAEDGKLHLIAGAHRLEACKLAGVKVRAEIVSCSEAEGRLLEIDENLIRRELSPFDRAIFLAERKEVYQRLYPGTRQHSAGGHGKARAAATEKITVAAGAASETFSFAKSTAEKIGIGERAIQRAVKINSGLSERSRAEIAGTWLAEKEGQLYALAGLDHDRQRAVLDLMLSEDGPTKVAAAEDAIQGRRSPRGKNQTQQALDKLIAAWARAPKRAQSGFIDYLAELGLARRV